MEMSPLCLTTHPTDESGDHLPDSADRPAVAPPERAGLAAASRLSEPQSYWVWRLIRSRSDDGLHPLPRYALRSPQAAGGEQAVREFLQAVELLRDAAVADHGPAIEGKQQSGPV